MTPTWSEVLSNRFVLFASNFDRFFNGPTRASFLFILFFSNKQYNFYHKSMWKNVVSIQYMVPWFEPTTSWILVVSHNHLTRAPAQIWLNFYETHISQNWVRLLHSKKIPNLMKKNISMMEWVWQWFCSWMCFKWATFVKERSIAPTVCFVSVANQ